jgi:hypothetical protein
MNAFDDDVAYVFAPASTVTCVLSSRFDPRRVLNVVCEMTGVVTISCVDDTRVADITDPAPKLTEYVDTADDTTGETVIVTVFAENRPALSGDRVKVGHCENQSAEHRVLLEHEAVA